MDNFEYSIQISDRDWEEFYSTAEECGLMQVSLATEEELWLSDTEREDATYSMKSRKPKFIRVSLCPPQEEHPAPQSTQVFVSLPNQTSYNCIDPSEDVLSGSEDEEVGSVTRFLCQKENLLYRKKKHMVDIPFPKLGEDHCTVNPHKEKSIVSPMSERKCYNEVDAQHHTAKTTTERSKDSGIFKGEVESGHSSNGPTFSVEDDVHSRTTVRLPYPNDSPECVHNIQCSSSVNWYLENRNIPDINKNTNKETSVSKMCQSQHVITLPESLGTNDQLNVENEIYEPPRNDQTRHGLGEPSSSKYNGLLHDTLKTGVQDSNLQIATKAIVNSSAVQQNIPSPIVEKLDVSSSKSYSGEIASNVTVNTHESSNEYYRNTKADCTAPIYSLVPVSVTGPSLQNRNQPTHLPEGSHRNSALTLPEMYDLFFDEFSETEITEPETNMTSKDGIVYTPDMYDYFFVEDEEENRTQKNKDDNTRQVSSTDLALASTPSEPASWPEAYEFFFADGPQAQDREGILFNMPPSQVQSAADILQPFVPRGLKGIMVRGAHHRRGTDGRLIPQDSHGTTEETNVATTGSLAPYLSPGRSGACLVFLALASWAVKSSDMQSSEGWKTALLANIGAVSAIRYLRRCSRSTWQESSPQPGEET